MNATVSDYLEQSPTAQMQGRLDLGAGRTLSIWENHHDRVFYDKPRGHTFSLYLKGGTGTRRMDAGGVAGWPGAICVLPEGHASDWEVTSPFSFLHLVVPDEVLRASFSKIHDRDARYFDLREIMYEDQPFMKDTLLRLAQALRMQDVLMADIAIADLVHALPARQTSLKGGLSQRQLRQVDEWIAAHLDGSIRLADLAMLCGQSEFHFHRMFRVSRGTTPDKWVRTRRLEAAKDRLRGNEAIADIASACGFSCQSHLTRVFKTETGMTPARYRSCVQKGL